MKATTRRKRAILRDRRRTAMWGPPQAIIVPMSGWDLFAMARYGVPGAMLTTFRNTAQLVRPPGMTTAEVDQAVREVWEGLTIPQD